MASSALPRRLGEGFGSAEGQLRHPRHALIDGSEVFIADSLNHQIVVLTNEGIWRRAFGTFGSGAGMLNQPQGVAIRGGRVYVADAWNHRIAIFSRTGNWLGAWGGDGSAMLSYPHALCFDGTNLYVASTGDNQVRPCGIARRAAARRSPTPCKRAAPAGAPLSSQSRRPSLFWPRGPRLA